MSRMILLLNLVVLVVNFAVAWGATDSQIGILDSTSRSSVSALGRRSTRDVSVSYLRVVQSLEGVLSTESGLDGSHMRAIYESVESYYLTVKTGVGTVLAQGGDAAIVRRALANVSRDARAAVASDLRAFVKDQDLVERITTAVLRNCR